MQGTSARCQPWLPQYQGVSGRRLQAHLQLHHLPRARCQGRRAKAVEAGAEQAAGETFPAECGAAKCPGANFVFQGEEGGHGKSHITAVEQDEDGAQTDKGESERSALQRFQTREEVTFTRASVHIVGVNIILRKASHVRSTPRPPGRLSTFLIPF